MAKVKNFRAILPKCCATCSHAIWVNSGDDLGCELEGGPTFDGSEFDKWFMHVCSCHELGSGTIGKPNPHLTSVAAELLPCANCGGNLFYNFTCAKCGTVNPAIG